VDEPIDAGANDDDLGVDATPVVARSLTPGEMRRLERIAARNPDPRVVLDALWDHILRDVEGFGVKEARARGFTWHRSEYTIPEAQLLQLMRIVSSHPMQQWGDEGDTLDIWFARSPILVDETDGSTWRW
jgi:hypothetical protein